MTKPVTIADLTANRKLIWLYCNDCYHEREIRPVTLPLPPSIPVPEVGKRLKCSKCACYHPLFVFNQFGDLERCALRPVNVHSADGWIPCWESRNGPI